MAQLVNVLNLSPVEILIASIFGMVLPGAGSYQLFKTSLAVESVPVPLRAAEIVSTLIMVMFGVIFIRTLFVVIAS